MRVIQLKSYQTYLALVEDVDSRATAAENLRVVLVDSTLGVTNSRDVLDHNNVIRVLALRLLRTLGGTSVGWLIQEMVGGDHVVDDTALADLLALELTLSGQVVTVVVTKMVVRGDGQRLDTSVDEEFGKDRLQLSLASLEIVTADEGLLALGKLDDTRDEGVLRSTVDEGLALKDRRDSEKGGRRDLGVRRLDRGKDIVSGVVHARNDVAVTFGVGSPEDDDTIETVVLLELADISPDVLKMGLLIIARNDVVRTSLLVGSDEVRVVDGWKRLANLSHEGGDLTLEVVVEHLGTLHSLVQGETRDIPTTEDEVIGVDHGENVRNRNVDILASDGVSTEADGGGTKHGADVVGLLYALLRVPDNVVTVGEHSSTERSAVVTAEANHQQTVNKSESDNGDKVKLLLEYSPSLGDLPGRLELEGLRGGLDEILPILDDDLCTTVGELGRDVLVRVRGVLRLHDDRVGATCSGGVGSNDRFELGLGSVKS